MRKRELLALAVSLMMLLTIGCASRSAADSSIASPQSAGTGDTTSYDYETAAEAEDYSEYTVSKNASSTESGTESADMGDADVRKIVYNADMTLTADDPELAMNTLVGKAEALGGYVSGSYSTTDDEGTYLCTLTLKVPADSLETLVSEAKNAGEVDDYRLTSDDISLSYYDVQARLDSAKAEEQQLLQILNKCETVEDILAVRESLASVRSDIESYTAQINLWDNLVDYATLDVTINRTEQTPVEGESDLIQIWKASDVWSRMTRGFQNSMRFMANALGAIAIVLAIVLIPAGILFLCIGLPIILHKKKKRRKAEAARAAAKLPAPEENKEIKNE